MSSSGIPTEMDRTEPVDKGVEQRLEFAEEYLFDGERVERETTVQLLEDGGVHVSQCVQGLHDSLTLSSKMMQVLREEYGGESDA